MSGKVFKNLEHLDYVDLNNSNCIDHLFHEQEEIKALAETVEEKCGASCGKAQLLVGLVLGGTQAKRGEWRFLVVLELRDDNEFFCGGNLISSRHVLTGEFDQFELSMFVTKGKQNLIS